MTNICNIRKEQNNYQNKADPINFLPKKKQYKSPTSTYMASAKIIILRGANKIVDSVFGNIRTFDCQVALLRIMFSINGTK